MALILISNDDGINAEGLRVLRESVKDLGRTIVFAPDGERSGYSHSLTSRKPIRVRKIGKDTYSPMELQLTAFYTVFVEY